MTLALWLVVAAAAVHVAEEYLWPGGFLDAMRRTAPRFAFAVNPAMAVVINAMFLAGVVIAALVGARVPVLALSAAALIAVNGWGHLAGTLRGRRYVPGTVTGLLISQPVAVLAYLQFAHAGLLSAPVVAASLILGAAYHLVPAGYLGTRWLVRQPINAVAAIARPPPILTRRRAMNRVHPAHEPPSAPEPARASRAADHEAHRRVRRGVQRAADEGSDPLRQRPDRGGVGRAVRIEGRRRAGMSPDRMTNDVTRTGPKAEVASPVVSRVRLADQVAKPDGEDDEAQEVDHPNAPVQRRTPRSASMARTGAASR